MEILYCGSFVNSLKRRNRDVKQAGFAVLRYTYMPSVLVETGFLTNRNEGLYLNSNKGQDRLANAIFKGIKAYIKSGVKFTNNDRNNLNK